MTEKDTPYDLLLKAASNARLKGRSLSNANDLVVDLQHLAGGFVGWVAVPNGCASLRYPQDQQPETGFLLNGEATSYKLAPIEASVKSEVVLQLKIGTVHVSTCGFVLSLTNVKGPTPAETEQTVGIHDRAGTVQKYWTFKTGGLDRTEKAKAYAKVYPEMVQFLVNSINGKMDT